jgi:hypothetical protein
VQSLGGGPVARTTSCGRPRPRKTSFEQVCKECTGPDCSFVTDKPVSLFISCRQLAREGARPTHAPHKHPHTFMSSLPLAKYRYQRRLPHLQKADCDLFVTFCTARRVLPPEARDIVMEHCLRESSISLSADGIENLAGEGARATRTRATPTSQASSQ